LNGTFAKAAWKPSPRGVAYTGLAPRTIAIGTCPAFMRVTSARRSANEFRRS
jgi:hypothetical protein